jgi:predicted nucleic acid-binding protein
VLKVVVDANILVSALFSPEGPIASTLFDARGRVELLSPELLLEELELHAERIARHKGADVRSIRSAIARLAELIRVVPLSTIPLIAREQADTLVRRIDPKDVTYVALAISQQALLWTLDKKLANALKKNDIQIAIDIYTMRYLIDQAKP